MVLFSRSDRLEFWLNGSRPWTPCPSNEKNGSSEWRKGPGNGLKNKALWVIGLINMAVLTGPVYVDVVCELNNYR